MESDQMFENKLQMMNDKYSELQQKMNECGDDQIDLTSEQEE